jgi:hypothetical protein
MLARLNSRTGVDGGDTRVTSLGLGSCAAEVSNVPKSVSRGGVGGVAFSRLIPLP